MSTNAIQAAIDEAYKAGGGKVIIPKGTFLSGSIILKSAVELHLEKKAILLGSKDPKDYKSIQRWKALILADSASNVSISGKGTIDGQGAHLAMHIDSLFYEGKIDSSDYNIKEKRPRVTIRPQLIEFVNCKNIRITDVLLKRSSSWVQTYFRCKNLHIDHIEVDSDTYWNNDGIDIVDCKSVRITNCKINSSDDGICLKSYYSSYRGKQDTTSICDSIYIGNCTIRSSASAVKLGTASYWGFKNVTIENIKVFDTYRSAIALESVHSGILENVLIQNVNAKNTGNAFFIRLGSFREYKRQGSLKNVVIRNMKVEITSTPADQSYVIRGPSTTDFHNVIPSSIVGLKNMLVKDILLENIEIRYPGGGNKAYAHASISRLDDIPELPKDYPEFSMFGELPAWGLYIRHLEGLSMRNIKLKAKNPDYRPAIVFDDVRKLKIESLDIGEKLEDGIIYHNSNELQVE